MKRSHGFYSKHSRGLKVGKRRGMTSLLAEFPVGSMVWIKVDARYGAKVPLRFNGRTAKIIKRQGKAYVVQFKDLNATKQLVLAGTHLQVAK